MKVIFLCVAALLLLGAPTMGTAAPIRSQGRVTAHASWPRLSSRTSPLLSDTGRIHERTLQTGSTPTPTPTAVASETATATPTGTPSTTPTATSTPTNTYPDPVTLLQNTAEVYSGVRRAHFTLISDLQQSGVEHIRMVANGDAFCHGPTLIAHVQAKDVKEGLNETAKRQYELIQIGKHYWIQPHGKRWQHATAGTSTAFSFSVQNPLNCPGQSQSSGGSETTKDVVNKGPETFRGTASWHVHAIGTLKIKSQTYALTFDYVISKKHFLPFEFSDTLTDAQHNVVLTQTQILTKFGENVKIRAPHISSPKHKKH